MRRFTDGEGREWDVVVGRESWGAFYALFLPRDREDDGEDRVRQTLLESEDYGSARRELAGLDDAEVGALLDRSEPKS